jgi:FkbM family methyltransferase
MKMVFVLGSTRHGPMIFSRLDYRMTAPGKGFGVGLQLLEKAAFDPEEVETAKQVLRHRKQHYGKGVVALDCGANIGVHTIEWAKCMDGWGEVIAIEAQERIYYALAGNITLNNCFNARALHAAVGDGVGEMAIPVPDYLTPASFGSLELKALEKSEFIGQSIDYAAGPMQMVRLLTIDSLNLKRLDFLKVDVEGMELEVLAGAGESIQRYKPAMLIEVIKSDKAEISKRLQAWGYDAFPMGLNILAVAHDDPLVPHIKSSRR